MNYSVRTFTPPTHTHTDAEHQPRPIQFSCIPSLYHRLPKDAVNKPTINNNAEKAAKVDVDARRRDDVAGAALDVDVVNG